MTHQHQTSRSAAKPLGLRAGKVAVAAVAFSVMVAPVSATADGHEEAASSQRAGNVYLQAGGGEFRWVKLCDRTAAERGTVLTKCDDDAAGYNSSIGYRFNEYLAMEVGGYYTEGFETEGGFSQTQFQQDRKHYGYTAGGAFHLPFSGDRVVLSARGGFHHWNTETETKPFGPNSNVSVSTSESDGTDFYYGGGVEFRMNDYFSLAADYTRQEVEGEESSLDSITGKLVISF